MMNTDIVKYYEDRAGEYEKIYQKPERRKDIQEATEILKNIFDGKEVYEIACGTGYWTQKIAETAKSVVATDINEAVIEIARQKQLDATKVNFAVVDIFNINKKNKYDAVFAGFIWSHIMLGELPGFIKAVNALALPGATVVFMDNKYVEGSNHPIYKADENGNTYQLRKLEDNSKHLVLKNFPDEHFLREKLSSYAINFQFIELEYFWILVCNFN